MDLNDPVTVWWIALVAAVVVTAVVAALLALVIRTAGDILDTVAVIWARGQQVANNTIHIAALYRTADLAEGISGRARRILGHAEAIRDHARTCPGCPRCILGPGGGA